MESEPFWLFLHDQAVVPEEMRTEQLRLRPLRAADAELEYDAVMSSAEQLRCWSPSDWPAGPLTEVVAHRMIHLE
jgi:RimJ/RimL family protein N-acetyltransferase